MADNGMNATINERGERVVVSLDAATRLESDVATVSVNKAACNCACSSALEDIQDVKLYMEILRSRVEALQSLANANEVCPSVDLYLSKIDQLVQENINEKRKQTNLKLRWLLSKNNFLTKLTNKTMLTIL